MYLQNYQEAKNNADFSLNIKGKAEIQEQQSFQSLPHNPKLGLLGRGESAVGYQQ